MRLVNSSYIGVGRVEICVNNEWGTVCDNGWTNLNAQIVCKQVGQSSLCKHYYKPFITFSVIQLDIKEEYFILMLTMVKVLVVYSLIMYSVLVLKID